jgi:hypothetical protein
MTLVPIHNIARHGVVRDLPDAALPPEAWTDAVNMRFTDDKASRFLGDQGVMGTPSAAPGFLMPVEGSGGVFWIYAEADGAGSHVYAFNSGTHAEISKSGGYTVTDARDWNGTVFHGTPIINPVSDDPQFWSALNLSTDLQDLTAWPASTTCKKIRTYKAYLVALHITDGDGIHGHRVLWSHRAAPGSIPSSWDHTDDTVDARIFELSDVNSGLIVEGLPLRDLFAIYKNESTWLMRFKGGTDVMEFANVLQVSGVLSPRVVVPMVLPRNKTQVHFLHNGIDVGVFNGNDFESIVDEKTRKFILGDIDPINYENTFAVDSAATDEIWMCYPEEGAVVPTKAMVWDYRRNTITFRGVDAMHAATGPVESASNTTWATVAGTWAEQLGAKWQEGARRRLVLADQNNTMLLGTEVGDTFNGTTFSSYLERTGLAIVGRDREGNPKVDYERRKLVTRLWPKIKGGRVRVTIGKSEQIDDDVNYVRADGKNVAIYDPAGGEQYVDVINDGRLIAVKFEGVDGDYWELESYSLDIKLLGGH